MNARIVEDLDIDLILIRTMEFVGSKNSDRAQIDAIVALYRETVEEITRIRLLPAKRYIWWLSPSRLLTYIFMMSGKERGAMSDRIERLNYLRFHYKAKLIEKVKLDFMKKCGFFN